MNKEVFMYAAIAIDRIVREYIDFVAPAKREYLEERLMKASYLEDESYEAVSEAVERTLSVMRHVEEMGTGDSSGHRLRQKRIAEVKSIMHVARSHPESAIKRLQSLPSKNLVNA